jgi:hypothetical protein
MSFQIMVLMGRLLAMMARAVAHPLLSTIALMGYTAAATTDTMVSILRYHTSM